MRYDCWTHTSCPSPARRRTISQCGSGSAIRSGQDVRRRLLARGRSTSSTAAHDLVNLRCLPAEGELLRAQYPDILPGFYSDKRAWISCLLDGELPEETLRDLCGRSYALTVQKLPKYVQRELAELPTKS